MTDNTSTTIKPIQVEKMLEEKRSILVTRYNADKINWEIGYYNNDSFVVMGTYPPI